MASVGFSISLLDNDLLWTLSDESVGASMSVYHMPFSHKVVLHGCFVLTIGLQLSLFVDDVPSRKFKWSCQMLKFYLISRGSVFIL